MGTGDVYVPKEVTKCLSEKLKKVKVSTWRVFLMGCDKADEIIEESRVGDISEQRSEIVPS